MVTPDSKAAIVPTDDNDGSEPQSDITPALVPFGPHWVRPSEVAALTTSKENIKGPNYKARYYLHVVLRSGERLSRYWLGWQYPSSDGDLALDQRAAAMQSFADSLNGHKNGRNASGESA